ncbi:MAG: hypothetical protein JSU85_01770 [Candidatus Zixiibacteriota bacterium]|nr:MAG: hypothetical protein JSU85_01770 [candidate division Zixibacteria bacterium]
MYKPRRFVSLLLIAAICFALILQLSSCGKDSDQPSAEPEYYIGNVNTEVFHRPTCSYLPDPENPIRFEARQETVDAGYRPCQHCNP